MLYRFAQEQLLHWYQREVSDRKPLIIRGARQVGKSTLVRAFCQAHQIKLIELNLERLRLSSLDEPECTVADLLQEIEIKSNTPFLNLQTPYLLFFDEIQAAPKLLSFLRYFFEEKPSLPVLAAGSLLEFSLQAHQYSMPVGRIEYLHLGPLTFDEYLLARKQKLLLQQLKSKPWKTSQLHFNQLSKLLREYYVIGGMPQAVQSFVLTGQITEARRVQQSIMETYIDDFSKYATKNEEVHLGQLIRSLPLHLGKKIKYARLAPDIKSAHLKKALQLLMLAKIVTPCIHSNGTSIPLIAHSDESIFKCFFLDIGLMNYLLGLEPDDLLFSKTSGQAAIAVEGLLTEQFVAQQLKAKAHSLPLFYWLKDKKNQAAEVDFLIQQSRHIIPLEVKSGTSGSLKSLHYFMLTHHPQGQGLAIRLDLAPRTPAQIQETIRTTIFDGEKKIDGSYQLLNVPLFLVNHLTALISPVLI